MLIWLPTTFVEKAKFILGSKLKRIGAHPGGSDRITILCKTRGNSQTDFEKYQPNLGRFSVGFWQDTAAWWCVSCCRAMAAACRVL